MPLHLIFVRGLTLNREAVRLEGQILQHYIVFFLFQENDRN